MTISEGDFFMKKTMVYHRKKIWVVFLCVLLMIWDLWGGLCTLWECSLNIIKKKQMIFMNGNEDIKAARGKILDVNGNYSGR